MKHFVLLCSCVFTALTAVSAANAQSNPQAAPAVPAEKAFPLPPFQLRTMAPVSNSVAPEAHPQAATDAAQQQTDPSRPPLSSESDDSRPSSDAAASTERVWYGWQTLIVEAGALTLMFAGAGMNSGSDGGGADLAILGLGAAALGPPIVHWAHGNVGKGFGSFGLMMGGPIVGAIGGGVIACAGDACKGEMGGLGALAGMLIGGLVGGVASVAIDSSVLAYDTPKKDSFPARTEPSALRMTPTVALTQQQASVGVVGLF